MPDPLWNAFWRIDPRPDGRRAPDGPLVDTLRDKLELITGGQAVAIVSAGLQATRLRPELLMISIEGIEPCQVVMARPAGDSSPLLGAAETSSSTHLTGSDWAGSVDGAVRSVPCDRCR